MRTLSAPLTLICFSREKLSLSKEKNLSSDISLDINTLTNFEQAYIIKCDKIIYLKEGRIIDVDIHENLYKKYDEYKELYLKQTENNMR